MLFFLLEKHHSPDVPLRSDLEQLKFLKENDYAFSNRMYDCLYNFCSNCPVHTI